MIVLNLWSDDRRRKPFDFDREFERSFVDQIAPGLFARIVSREGLILMKQEAGRTQDLADIEELCRVERLKNENT